MFEGVMEMFVLNLEHISYTQNEDTNTSFGRAVSIANDLNALQLGSEHLHEYFVSGCYDGQYVLADIETKLREIMKLPAIYDCYWDFAHRLERKHKRVLEQLLWAKNTLDLTNKINNAFKHSDKKTQSMNEFNCDSQNEVKNKKLKGHAKVSNNTFVFQFL